MAPRTYTTLARVAAQLLGARIRAARIQRRWTERGLAERAGVSINTVRGVEEGRMTVAVGTVFDIATLVGIPLFHEESDQLERELMTVRRELALLPKRARPDTTPVDDDF